uniref:Uncharacterized protein n=1 Tax=Setaria italica TaxID=4555 RepID=K3ZBQ8_SETIT
MWAMISAYKGTIRFFCGLTTTCGSSITARSSLSYGPSYSAEPRAPTAIIHKLIRAL